ncbi:MAG: T9SS type A sorting domain-containing protein, partial [Bacteroidota bacterium]
FAQTDTWRTLDYGFSYADFYNSFDQGLGGHVVEGIKPYISARFSSTQSQLQLNPVPPLFSETRSIPRFPVFGDSIFVRTWIEDEQPIQNAELTYRWNGGPVQTPQTAPLLDDGMHRDYTVNDGYFGASAGTATTGDTLFYYIQHTDPTGRTGREPRTGWKYVVVSGIPYIRINEWCSSNSTLIADEAGEFDDWIELYNPISSNEPWERIHISDSVANLGKWRLPDTTVSGNGFLLLWADEDKSQGPTHMNFKLSALLGESIVVSYYNGESYRILDSVSFGPMSTDQSLGCVPDGVRPIVWQQPPSPGGTNLFTGLEELTPSGQLLLFPNPATTGFRINLTGVITLTLTDISGKIAGQFHQQANMPFSTEGIADGLYICSVFSENSEARHCRLLIRR